MKAKLMKPAVGLAKPGETLDVARTLGNLGMPPHYFGTAHTQVSAGELSAKIETFRVPPRLGLTEYPVLDPRQPHLWDLDSFLNVSKGEKLDIVMDFIDRDGLSLFLPRYVFPDNGRIVTVYWTPHVYAAIDAFADACRADGLAPSHELKGLVHGNGDVDSSAVDITAVLAEGAPGHRLSSVRLHQALDLVAQEMGYHEPSEGEFDRLRDKLLARSGVSRTLVGDLEYIDGVSLAGCLGRWLPSEPSEFRAEALAPQDC